MTEPAKIASDDIALARSLRLQRQPLVNPLVGEIVEALMLLGGAAHRDAVADAVAVARGGRFASEGLRRDLIAAFDANVAAAPAGVMPLLYLPFGDGSRRWALTHDALAFLREAPKREAV